MSIYYVIFLNNRNSILGDIYEANISFSTLSFVADLHSYKLTKRAKLINHLKKVVNSLIVPEKEMRFVCPRHVRLFVNKQTFILVAETTTSDGLLAFAIAK